MALDLKARFGHLPSTALGLGSAGVVAYCQSGALLKDWKSWIPVVGLALWGASIKGPQSSAGNSKGGATLKGFLPILAALLLAGCVTGGLELALPSHPEPTSLAEVFATLKGDTVIDLDAADAIAIAHNDQVAHACYPVMKKYLAPETGKVTVDQVKGFVSGFEKARVERIALEGKVGQGIQIPTDLKLGCSALLMDERQFIIRMAALVGGGAAGIPGLGRILPK